MQRRHLVDRLLASRRVPLALIVAPAGYGKTVLVRQWAELDERPFAHVELDENHNDPAALTLAVAEALNLVAPGDSEAALLKALTAMGQPFVLVMDDAQVLRAREALELLGTMIDQLGPGSQIAFVSRTEPGLAVGRLRAHRELVELRAPDLVMTKVEAAGLVKLSGIELDGEPLDLLVRLTEGWPAGLYLAALELREAPDASRILAGFAGDDRLVADYLREELLANVRPAEIEFLTRASILDRLSGPLCDFVLERSDSARQLRALSRMNLLVVPLDRTDTEYRYHRLFAQMLRGELRRGEPEQERALHGRAGDWYEQHGEIDRAIDHAIAAEDDHRAGELLWGHASPYIAYGHNAKVRRWLESFSDEQIAACPTLALTAAATELALGNGGLAERWASAARSAPAPGDDVTLVRSFEAASSVIKAVVAADGIVHMGEEATRAYDLGRDESPWRAVACALAGASAHLVGERERARGCLEEGARRGAAVAPTAQVLCLAQLALLALEEDDPGTAEVLAARAKAQVERIGLDRYATSALVYAVSADVLARLGRVEDAGRDVDTAGELLDRLTDFASWYELECRISLARAALRMSDLPGARTLLSDASRRLQQVPEASVAREWLDDCWAQADAAVESCGDDGWSLTTAELRVLQFLPTHLSLPEIAGRLFVSPNTVKTHARAVYRKLDASSRGEAVLRARNAGLLIPQAS